MIKLLFILSVIGFMCAGIRIELFLLYKSQESFKELRKAYKELKDAKQDLKDLLK